MSIPENLFYSNDHEWVKIEGETATIGISDHAQEQLGEITFVELPAVGQGVDVNGVLGAIESSKAASDIFAPVGGEVCEINDALEEQPELVNESCYEKGWICKLTVGDAVSTEGLMDAKAYGEYLKGLEE